MKNFAVFLFLAFSITACGFQPIYMQNGGSYLPNVSVGYAPERIGQIMTNELKTRFGAPSPNFDKVLKLKLSSNTSGLGVEADSTYAVSEVTVSSEFILVDKSNQNCLDKFTISRSTTFTTFTKSSFANDTARDLAEKQAIATIAEIAHNRIIAYLNSDYKKNETECDRPR